MARHTILVVRKPEYLYPIPFPPLGRDGDHLLGIFRFFRDHPDWKLASVGLPLPTPQAQRPLGDLYSADVAGAIVEGDQDDVIAACRRRRIPVVAMNRFRNDPRTPSVCHDDAAIGRLGAEYFLRRGFRSLAFCGPHYLSIRDEPIKGEQAAWVVKRQEGFTKAAKRAGVRCAALYDAAGSPAGESEEAGRKRFARDLREMVRSLPRPAGILACADVWATDCLRACEEEGLRVPQDVAVLGVDNNAFRCELCTPSLSSVDRNMFRVGYESAALLSRFLTDAKWGSTPVLVRPAGIVERRSTDALAVENPRLVKALRFVRERFCDQVSPHDAARAAGVSESWLRRAFRQELGFSIVSEMRRLRVEKACDLLSSTDLPLKAIADLTGLRSVIYLCHVFAKEMGVSPRAWADSSRRPRVGKGD